MATGVEAKHSEMSDMQRRARIGPAAKQEALKCAAHLSQLLTGQQAEAYADHFIAVHLSEIGGGKTYSQLSAESIAQPKNVALAAQVATVFKGTTLRSMLLNAYGWWKVSQITYIASLVAFGLAGLAFLSSLAALTLGHKPEITHEVITGTTDQTKVA